MTEAEVAGHTYEIGRLNAIQQLHVARRLSLAFAKELPKFVELVKRWSDSEAKGEKLIESDEGIKIFEPFAEAVGRMTDADFEMIVKTCAGGVRRRTEAGTWTRITPPTGDVQLMFTDINASVLIVLIWKVVEANLTDFFPGLRFPTDDQVAKALA